MLDQKHSSRKLLGLNSYFSKIIKLIDINKLPKIIMLTGKKGQGKSILTHHILAYYFDRNNYNLEKNIIMEGNKIYNDLRENSDSNILYFNCADQNIKIENIRKLRTDLQKTSLNTKNRYIVFDDVENLNINCVNALLKTIEEPTEINYFILINNQSKPILDTLKSRSIEINIFLNQNQRNQIIEALTQKLEIEHKIDLNNNYLTPGNFLKFNQIAFDEKIDVYELSISEVEKLIKLYKTKKNKDYLDFVIYYININFYRKSLNLGKIDEYSKKKSFIAKKIHDFYTLNLNQSNLISEIQNYI